MSNFRIITEIFYFFCVCPVSALLASPETCYFSSLLTFKNNKWIRNRVPNIFNVVKLLFMGIAEVRCTFDPSVFDDTCIWYAFILFIVVTFVLKQKNTNVFKNDLKKCCNVIYFLGSKKCSFLDRVNYLWKINRRFFWSHADFASLVISTFPFPCAVIACPLVKKSLCIIPLYKKYWRFQRTPQTIFWDFIE